MSTYAQWRRAADRGEVARVTYLCGKETGLREEAVDTIRGLLRPADHDYVFLVGGFTPDKGIWATAHQHPLTPGANRLILVRDAEKIRTWRPLRNWLDSLRQLPGVYLLFVSGEHDFPAVTVDGKRLGLQPHVELIQQRRRMGQIVRCSTPNEADSIAWVRRRAPLDEKLAAYVLQRSGGDLLKVSAVCSKLQLLPEKMPIGAGVVDALCTEAAADDFVESLLFLRKPQALLALEGMSDSEYGPALGLLDARLDLLGALCEAVRTGHSTPLVAKTSPFLVKQFMPVAKYYEESRCVHRRQALAVVDSAYRSGARAGVMEALVALW